METTLLLSQANLNAIKESIQVELLKRGITSPIVEIKEVTNGSSHYILFNTAEFQTVPVMFKKLWVNNFGSSVARRPKSDLSPDTDGEYIFVWISVHYSYESFSGGSNGTSLFDIWFNVFGESEYDVKMKAIR